MGNTNEISVSFIHPSDGRVLTVTLDVSLTCGEIVNELITNQFITSWPAGYHLSLKGGGLIKSSETLPQAGVKDGDELRVIPETEGGGATDPRFKTAVPGLRKSRRDTFTLKDVQQSPEAVLMIVHMYDNLQEKYEQQSELLEYERARANDRFVATLLLLISQVVLSIGTNLLTSNSKIAVSVIVAGSLQSAIAIFLTFRKKGNPPRSSSV